MSEPPKLYLGAERTGETRVDVAPEAADLTTHAAIVGMTGSGKTGLGVVLLEEALRAGIPALVIDPKGDMGNLALRFPNLSAGEFAPWLEPGADAGAAEATAQRWRSGLADWGIGTPELEQLDGASEVTVYTPGSKAGVGLDILGSLAAPTLAWDDHSESLVQEIHAFVAGLLGLLGVDADPLTSREYILLANLIQHAWQSGRSLDLQRLIAEVQKPPLRKLGVFELDTFFPAKDRLGLAMRINGLVANPGFASWIQGAPLSIEQLLWTPEKKPRAAVVYLAHLTENERQFVVTLLLSKVVTWMRSQPGSSSLRALIYMDEVFGFAPPTANPPSKGPILTILKQARAHGIGMVLSTQNPVDLDYKAMSNAGMWMVGRLQTERDKARILEGLRSADGNVDVSELDARIGGLGKREFVFHTTRSAKPRVFSTRWAMSFLRGPLTLDDLGRLPSSSDPSPVTAVAANAAVAEPATAATTTPDELGDDESSVEPKIAEAVRTVYLDPAAEWSREVGASPGGRRLELGLAVRVSLTFDERAAELDHREEWEAVFYPVEDPFESSPRHVVDHDPRDFESAAPEGAVYATPSAPVHTKKFMAAVSRWVKAELYREEKLTLFRNRALKLYSRVGESTEAFADRCAKVADARADVEVAKLHDKAKRKLASMKKRMQTAERQLSKAETAASTASRDEVVSGMGSVLGAIFGSKTASSIAGKAGGFSSRRGRSARSKARKEAAEDKIEDITEEMAAFEEELTLEVEDLRTKWADVAAETEDAEIGLEKSDVVVDDVVGVWIPVT